MPGRPPKVDHLRVGFVGAIRSARGLYSSVQAVGAINPATQCPTLHTEHVRRVVELAFMGVIGSWEEFLEQTLVRYIAGAKCDGGYKPSLRLGKASSIQHAYHLITADPHFEPTSRFIALSHPSTTIDLAKLFLEGGRPYAVALQKKTDRLLDAVRLRNRIAHSSTKSREDFKLTARSFLNLGTHGKLTKGYRVGDLLTASAQRHFGLVAATQQKTYFEAFMMMFADLAEQIVPK